MTGRRAVRQWDERLSRALQFVPGHVGGRVASAQPIRRRGGTLRRPSVGAVEELVAPPEYVGGYGPISTAESTGVSASLLTRTVYTNYSDVYETASYVTPATGDVLVVLGLFAAEPTHPTGWTVVDSGTLPNGSFWVVWSAVKGTPGLGSTFTLNAPTDANYSYMWAFRNVDPALAVTAADVVETSGTALTLPDTNTSLAKQVGAVLTYTAASHGVTWSPSNPGVTYGKPWAAGSNFGWSSYAVRFGLQFAAGLTFDADEPVTGTASTTVSSIAVAIGFA